MATKDFTRERERITFTIDSDTFEATPALPGQTLTEFARRFADVTSAPNEAKLGIITDALSMVLLPDSAALFTKRFSDLENPIELDQATEVLIWIMEQYGLRPTQPSLHSASGSPNPEPGTNSTDVQPQPGPTSLASPPTGS
jgi:hypothetical protein